LSDQRSQPVSLPVLLTILYQVAEDFHALIAIITIFLFCVRKKIDQKKQQPRDCSKECLDYLAYAVGHKVFAVLFTESDHR
jgi:hypothetical protein